MSEEKSWDDLVSAAKSVLYERKLGYENSAGTCAAALETDKGNVYLGVCIDVACSMGFCAEHAAIAAMVTAGESRICRIVAVNEGGIVPPCGRCREFIKEIDEGNGSTVVLLSDGEKTIDELLPCRWR